MLPFLTDVEEALKPGAVEIHPGGNLSLNNQRQRQPQTYKRGNVAEGLQAADHVFEDNFTSAHHNNAQLEMRVSVAEWTGDKLTVHAATQGIANCRTDIAKDLKISADNVRVISEYMGGGFGNKNQCQDSDLMAALLAKQAGAPVKLEFTRKEDFVAVHGRWSSRQSYKVGVKNDGTLTAIQFTALSGAGAYRKGSCDLSGTEIYQVPHLETQRLPRIYEYCRGRELSRPGVSAGRVWDRVADGRCRLRAQDGSRGVPPQEYDAEISRSDTLHQQRS